MKKKLLGIMFVFILIQFVRPEKNISKKQENDISK